MKTVYSNIILSFGAGFAIGAVTTHVWWVQSHCAYIFGYLGCMP